MAVPYITETQAIKIAKQYGGSSGGESPVSESAYDYVTVRCNLEKTITDEIIIMFDKKYIRQDSVTQSVNELITYLNSMSGLSIPAYTKLEDLETIANYLHNVDSTAYHTVKVIFWASIFQACSHYSLSANGHVFSQMTAPVIILGYVDIEESLFTYYIYALTNSGQVETVADYQSKPDFLIYVNRLDNTLD